MFEAVATQFAQQANLTDVFTNITVITELVSVHVGLYSEVEFSFIIKKH